ncbi:hypothetical protein [Dialister sp.]|uniref:hypothetical protein n=1 Tax=Dialister sp. TaxID=1955814 RepID=UPI003F0C063E
MYGIIAKMKNGLFYYIPYGTNKRESTMIPAMQLPDQMLLFHPYFEAGNPSPLLLEKSRKTLREAKFVKPINPGIQPEIV